MKAIVLAVIFQIILSGFTYSQENNYQPYHPIDTYWSMSLYGGGANSLIEINEYKISSFGATGGLEAAINFPEVNSAILFSFSLTTSFPAHNTEYYKYKREYKNEKIEISIGPRFYLNNNFFVQGAFGAYMQSFRRIYQDEIINPEFYYSYGNYSDNDGGFGFNIGGGRLFNLSKSVSLITLGKLHFSSPKNHGILYFTLDAGLQFKNNNAEKNSGKNESKMSAAVYGGFANMEGVHSVVYQVLPNFGIEGTYRTGFNELFINIFFNLYNYKSSSNLKPRTLTAILLGERLFIGREATRGFFEFGGGVYAYENNTSSKTTADNIGIITGTGICQKLYSRLSGIIKADINWIFNEHLHENKFLTLDAGLRWDF